MPILHLFRTPGITDYALEALLHKCHDLGITEIQSECCFNVGFEHDPLTIEEYSKLGWLLKETFEPEKFSSKSFLKEDGNASIIVEVGPRLSFTTAWSTNAVTICHNCGIDKIKRIERSIRYLIKGKEPLSEKAINSFVDEVHDRMTQCRYMTPLQSFATNEKPLPVVTVPVLEQGQQALEEINKELGLAFDEHDIQMYLKMFKDMGRNPTNVELFDLSQSNSEHSRHWFFRGKLVIDGKEMPESLMTIVKQTLTEEPNNSVLAFCDNSSAIEGTTIDTLLPQKPGEPSAFISSKEKYDIIFTAETHNFPTGVAPFPGAETGTGGRIRDVHATGRGGLVVGGTAAYCVGNLQIPGYKLPWEDPTFEYPTNIARPLKIEIDASNGASDYGNKFGEPVIQGFTRSFGLVIPNGERREWIKPIMFTGGIGQMNHIHAIKKPPKPSMIVVKIGGPAYRIGIGGGAASSLVHGENKEKLDFNAVQRGDAEMENKLNRVIKACVELRDKNPIISIHDQGAGGSGNVLKEIVDPEGARIEIRKMLVGDETLSVLEIWGAEYQENDALLIEAQHKEVFESICKREHMPVAFVGVVTGDGKVIVHDELDETTPVNLDLEKVLGKMPAKTFPSEHQPKKLLKLLLPTDLTISDALNRTLRLLSVGSKLFLTNKVDRSVTGLIAQQQCVGPLQLPLSNCAVIAQSYFSKNGAVTAIGEQPIKGLLDNKAMARMTVGEMITNIMWAQISALEHIKCSGNWMWAAKLPGEGAEMYDAAVAMRDMMLQLGVAIDGGKDSLSMASKVKDATVKGPGTLVVSGYATCPDITKTLTPDIKFPGTSELIFIDLANGKQRMGGSALAHVFKQIGSESPDVDEIALLKRGFQAIQELISKELLVSGHDRSDGGLITTLLEMAFAGNCGIEVTIKKEWLNPDIITFLFNEELGLVIEVKDYLKESVTKILSQHNLTFVTIAKTTLDKKIVITQPDQSNPAVLLLLLEEDMTKLRDVWNETSHQLELLQANPKCVEQEVSSLKNRKGINYKNNLKNSPTLDLLLSDTRGPRVAVLREEGSNGDREMAAAFYASGFDVWDVTMSDLLDKKVFLNDFYGIAFVGGFSYADVLDSGKGWAGVIRFNKDIYNQFETFYNRKDTFSLGVCNGCQLMALMGFIPWKGISDKEQPRFIHNVSGRFESRFSSVKILPSPAIMLKGLEGSVLGIWVSHGEGRSFFENPSLLDTVTNDGPDGNLAPVRYVDDDHAITEQYPFNPNGSPRGIASLCSKDGRHLAIMPHPERSIFNWQWPYTGIMSSEERARPSPWLQMFHNAREFCEKQRK